MSSRLQQHEAYSPSIVDFAVFILSPQCPESKFPELLPLLACLLSPMREFYASRDRAVFLYHFGSVGNYHHWVTNRSCSGYPSQRASIQRITFTAARIP